MTTMELDPLLELNRLWAPVRPYLARQVSELYGRRDGRVLEVGPFSGLALELARSGLGATFQMAVFPGEVAEALRGEALEMGLEERVTITESDENLSGVPAAAFDLVVFRGAFFFPSFFRPDLSAVYRSLKPGGLALVGGGFGSHTPEEVIRRIENRSKDLNQALGRVRINERDLGALLEAAELRERATVITAGGLWVLLRTESGWRPRKLDLEAVDSLADEESLKRFFNRCREGEEAREPDWEDHKKAIQKGNGP